MPKVPTEGPKSQDTEGAEAGGRSPATATAPRLDEATNSYGGNWITTAWPTCGEGTVVFHVQVPPEEEPSYVAPGEGTDPARAAQEAARRAATTLRRFVTHHELDRLATLTYAPNPDRWPGSPGHRPVDTDLDDVVRDIAKFRRRLNEAMGENIAIVTVIEHHADGHLHVHFCFGQYLDKRTIERAWGRGWVDLRQFKSGPGQAAVGKRERCRINASYLSAYLKKDFTEGHQFGRHRYSTTRGMAPTSRSYRSASRNGGRAWLRLTMGSDPARVWCSDELEGWDKPPVLIAYWGDPPDE